MILLWYKILQLIVRQVNYDVNLRDLSQQVDFLIPYIVHVGEDRDTTGLLGVIGLGRKSPLSPRFVHAVSSTCDCIDTLRFNAHCWVMFI